jgi:acid phosphatase type 7
MIRKLPRLLALLGVLLAGCSTAQPPQSPNILLGPYVTAVSETSARVLWVADPNAEAPRFSAAASSSLVPAFKLVPVKAEVTTSPIPGWREVLHSASLTGLRGGDSCMYTIRDSKGIAGGHFTTALPAGAQPPFDRFRFLVYGDTRSFPDRHRAVAEAAGREQPFAFTLNTGDFTANGTTLALWKQEFFDPAGELLRRTPIWPVRGNHEPDANLYAALFEGLPHGGLYYSFDFGNAHFVMLDSGGLEDRPADPAMLDWLEKDLSATRAEWKFAVYHRPSADTAAGGKTWGRRDVWPILERHGVDMIFSGHSHVYERFRPVGSPGGKPMIQIVSGGGGAPTYEVKPSPILEVGYDGTHYCMLELAGADLRMTVKSPDGNVIDRLSLSHQGSAFDPETMARTMTAPEAWEIAYILTGFTTRFAEAPSAGTPVAVVVPGNIFPNGSTVQIAPLTENPWAIQPTQLMPADEDLQLMVTPPKGFVLPSRDGAGLKPPIRVKVSVTYMGKTYTRNDFPIDIAPPTRTGRRQ